MANFRKRGKTWQFRLSYKDNNGEYKKFEKGGYKTKKEAEAAADEAKKRLNNHSDFDNDISLYDFFEKWAKVYKKPHVTEATWRTYKRTLNLIDKYIKDKPIAEITPTFYQAVLNKMSLLYRQESLDKFYFQIKSAMKIAVHEKVISENFADFTKAKSKLAARPVEEKYLHADEYLKLLAIAEEKMEYTSYFACYLTAVTGMRFAELLGLTWDHVDFSKKEISIQKTWDYSITNDFADTKNESSKRKIPISSKTINLLKKYKKEYWHENKYDRVIYNLSNNGLNKTIKVIAGRKVHPHSLRHSFASYLIYKGIDLLTVSKLLGHENLNVTLKVYAHQLKEMEQENNDVIRKIFNKL
ncbi:site-specific integrase [Lactococcus lactis]|uniref:site-specific integrase n=1 Tax=Lactococcus lactis TaxID=1358 RepID=UPI0024685147|nr:site-specific integrase [Lactococcus lactis]MDH5114674.1 site-specific integrase [Lactococcus lactis]